MKTHRIIFSLFLFVLILGNGNLFASCNIIGEQGDGNVTKETRTVTGFNNIDVSGAFDIYLSQGNEGVVVEADANLLPIIKTVVKGSTLHIYCDKPISHPTKMTVYIKFKDLEQIGVSGACDLFSEARLTLPKLGIESSGASDSKLDLAVGELNLGCSGASKMTFTGTAGKIEADLSGACDIHAFDLVTETFVLDLSGAGSAEINVTKKIQAEISGAGNVRYKGNPVEVDQRVSGAGSIKKVQ